LDLKGNALGRDHRCDGWKQKFHADMDRFDVDQDGVLSSSELQSFMSALGQNGAWIKWTDGELESGIDLDELKQFFEDSKRDEAVESVLRSFGLMLPGISAILHAIKVHASLLGFFCCFV
jgi:hypothetical protein